MTKINFTEMRKLRDRAFFKIVMNKETELLWDMAATREDRDLLLTWAIFEIAQANKNT